MAKKAAKSPVGALQYLVAPQDFNPGPICAIVGDEGFLRHEVRVAMKSAFSNSAEDELSITSFEGKSAELRDVLDTLSERSLFGSEERIVVVEEADPFVKQYREQLEDYVAKPMQDALLVLEVKTLPGNTRLAKAINKDGLAIRCQVPEKGRELTEFNKQLKDWLIKQAKTQHNVKLEREAVDVLLELLPTEVGILAQEVARLSLLLEAGQSIDSSLVRDNVGGWRTRKTWDMIDAAAEGRAADALDQLDRLIAAGEEPHALLPQMASTLRRFAAAVRIYQLAERNRRNISLRTALEKAGVPPFKMRDAESQLRQIGRVRAADLYHWLLAADLELKGHNSTKERARRVLETLVIRLSKQMSQQATTAR